MNIFESLPTITLVFLGLCLLCVCAFEFINGFHDTANAVATVIYTKSLKPLHAVIYSGFLNFLGMSLSLVIVGPKVALGIVKLMPINDMVSQATSVGIILIFSVLIAAIIWNFVTWYLGIPCSSSHTLVGSLLGGGIAFQYFYNGDGPNWEKASEIGMSLLISPLFGFAMVILFMIILRLIVKNKVLFSEPEPDSKPPTWIRVVLFCTCGLVSFFHGMNDGQKGLGLLLVILMTFLPLHFAINQDIDIAKTTTQIDKLVSSLTYASQNAKDKDIIKSIETATEIKTELATLNKTDKKQLFKVRKAISSLGKSIDDIKLEQGVDKLDEKYIDTLKSDAKPIRKLVEDAPIWTVLMISFCLGLGTMIGWKRIVVTIGEKIGKSHLTYAQGASAELVAAITIGLSSKFGLPVSTTHVLSSGIAGSMVAAKGVKNLQKGTLINIGIAWILTLPVTILLSALLFFIFHLFI